MQAFKKIEKEKSLTLIPFFKEDDPHNKIFRNQYNEAYLFLKFNSQPSRYQNNTKNAFKNWKKNIKGLFIYNIK